MRIIFCSSIYLVFINKIVIQTTYRIQPTRWSLGFSFMNASAIHDRVVFDHKDVFSVIFYWPSIEYSICPLAAMLILQIMFLWAEYTFLGILAKMDYFD